MPRHTRRRARATRAAAIHGIGARTRCARKTLATCLGLRDRAARTEARTRGMQCSARALHRAEAATRQGNVVISCTEEPCQNGGGCQETISTARVHLLKKVRHGDYVDRISAKGSNYTRMMDLGCMVNHIGLMMAVVIPVMATFEPVGHRGERCDRVAPLGGHIRLATRALAGTVGLGMVLMIVIDLAVSLAPLGSVGGRGSTPFLLDLCSLVLLDRPRPAFVVIAAAAVLLAERGAIVRMAGSAQRIMPWTLGHAQLGKIGKLQYGGGRRPGCTFRARDCSATALISRATSRTLAAMLASGATEVPPLAFSGLRMRRLHNRAQLGLVATQMSVWLALRRTWRETTRLSRGEFEGAALRLGAEAERTPPSTVVNVLWDSDAALLQFEGMLRCLGRAGALAVQLTSAALARRKRLRCRGRNDDSMPGTLILLHRSTRMRRGY